MYIDICDNLLIALRCIHTVLHTYGTLAPPYVPAHGTDANTTTLFASEWDDKAAGDVECLKVSKKTLPTRVRTYRILHGASDSHQNHAPRYCSMVTLTFVLEFVVLDKPCVKFCLLPRVYDRTSIHACTCTRAWSVLSS